jgi:DNA-binding FadR family transcriptional regulator
MLAHATKNAVFPIVLRALMDVTRRVIRVRTISVDRLKKHISFYRSVHQALENRDFAVALKKLNEHMIAVKEQYLRRSSYKDKNRI